MISKTGKTKLGVLLVLPVLVISLVFLNMGTIASKLVEIERPTYEKAIPESYIIYTTDKESVKNFVKSKGAVVKYDYMSIEAIGVKKLPEAALEGLRNMPGVTRIFQDRELHKDLTESIPQIRADEVNATGYGIRACVLDTGIDNYHPAFGSRIIAQRDFVNNDDWAQDDEGHGTHCAGILASEDSTYRGVARGAYLIAGKVLDAGGGGTYEDVIAGLEWCAYTVDADIISMSLGGGQFFNYCDSDPLAEVANEAVNNGVVVVSSSGNDAWDNAMGTPACGSKVIAVGGVYDSNWAWVKWGCQNPECTIYLCKDEPAIYDTRFCASNGGPQLDVVAPGAITMSAKLGGGWTEMGGTSMACPHVAGLAGLVIEKGESLEPKEVQTLIRNNSVDKGDPGFDYIYGYGRIDAKATWDATIAQSAFCGNNDEEYGEECDGTDLGGTTCESLGLDPGTLTCDLNCNYDTTQCGVTTTTTTIPTTTTTISPCGDGYCAGQDLGEDCNTCPEDCPKKKKGNPSKRWCCGNLVCESDWGETAGICPVDCGGVTTSTTTTIPSECKPRGPNCNCNGICDGKETPEKCPWDCP